MSYSLFSEPQLLVRARIPPCCMRPLLPEHRDPLKRGPGAPGSGVRVWLSRFSLSGAFFPWNPKVSARSARLQRPGQSLTFAAPSPLRGRGGKKGIFVWKTTCEERWKNKNALRVRSGLWLSALSREGPRHSRGCPASSKSHPSGAVPGRGRGHGGIEVALRWQGRRGRAEGTPPGGNANLCRSPGFWGCAAAQDPWNAVPGPGRTWHRGRVAMSEGTPGRARSSAPRTDSGPAEGTSCSPHPGHPKDPGKAFSKRSAAGMAPGCAQAPEHLCRV